MKTDLRAFELKGKNIVITGGRTGLGFAMAGCVRKAGGFPIIVGSSPAETMKEAADKIGGAGYHFDVTKTGQAQEFVDGLTGRYGKVDALINNAGIHLKKPFEDTRTEDYEKVFRVHVLGAAALARATLKGMKERREGSILFISSMSAMIGMTQVSAYSAAKSAVLGLVKSLTGECSSFGIRVNAISPGFIDTPMFHQAVDADPERQKRILSHTPMESYGRPEDIGWAAVYLCSDASRFVTGVNLPVDGGCSIGF